jgi:hypothetical protein
MRSWHQPRHHANAHQDDHHDDDGQYQLHRDFVWTSRWLPFNRVAAPLGQKLPLNFPTNRRLCSTVGRIIERRPGCRRAVFAARSRAATTTNLARSSQSLALSALFGAAKSCALLNVFMMCPRCLIQYPAATRIFTADRGGLMA